MTMLSNEAQIRYLVQWFQEWSDLQRSDFLPIMAEKYANKAYVNGITSSISNVDFRDKPMSLFECRGLNLDLDHTREKSDLRLSRFMIQVKLFKEWFMQWTAEQKESFLNRISEIDSAFADKLNAELENGIPHINNEVNGEVLED